MEAFSTRCITTVSHCFFNGHGHVANTGIELGSIPASRCVLFLRRDASEIEKNTMTYGRDATCTIYCEPAFKEKGGGTLLHVEL